METAQARTASRIEHQHNQAITSRINSRLKSRINLFLAGVVIAIRTVSAPVARIYALKNVTQERVTVPFNDRQPT